jgi:hypothetical protein
MCYSNPPSPQPSPPLSLITRQFWGELEVRQILPPSYRFPPRAGGTKQRFPLRSRGNLTEGVFKKCRAMSLEQGGEGTGVEGSASEKPLRCTEQGWLMYTLIRNHAGEAIFSNTLRQHLTFLTYLGYHGE